MSDELHALWFYILQAHDSEDGTVDYDGCLEALGFGESPGTKTDAKGIEEAVEQVIPPQKLRSGFEE